RPLVLPTLGAVALTAASTAPAVTRLPGIRSPSGNISCLYVPGRPSMLLCKIGRAGYVKQLEAHCAAPPLELDWAGFTLAADRKGGVACSGGILYSPDTQRPSYVTLPYGKTWRHGACTRWARATGITC